MFLNWSNSIINYFIIVFTPIKCVVYVYHWYIILICIIIIEYFIDYYYSLFNDENIDLFIGIQCIDLVEIIILIKVMKHQYLKVKIFLIHHNQINQYHKIMVCFFLSFEYAFWTVSIIIQALNVHNFYK